MGLAFHNASLERLCDESGYSPAQVDAIGTALTAHGTLLMTPLSTGLYPASSAVQGTSTGYHRVWVRDNVYVGFAQLQAGRPEAAAAVARALLTFYTKYRHRFAIARGAGQQEPDSRPHVRFDGERLEELHDERWAHAQNDALGYCLWLCARLARTRVVALDTAQFDTMTAMVKYLADLRYWDDEDSGHWEETRKRSASSIGVVAAGLREWLALLEDGASGLSDTSRDDLVARGTDALQEGLRSLGEILPRECLQPPPRHRRYDAALLFLAFPLQVITGEMADRVIRDVHTYLQGQVGIRRYLGDSYWAPDYDTRLSPQDWARDYSHDIEVRNRLLERAGDEAQWCLFDSVLSAYHGQRFLDTGSGADRESQVLYFNRALAQVSAEWRCPELYFWKGGVLVANPHTPLLWTQANLQLALAMLRLTAGRGR